MVRYISLSLLLIFFSLAMISRKFYSKYKAVKNPFWCLADAIVEHLPMQLKLKISEHVRKTDTYNVRQLHQKTDEWLTNLVYRSQMMIILLTVIVFLLTFAPEQKVDKQKLYRPGVGEFSNYEEIELIDRANNKREKYELEVHSREYTEGEFKEKAEQFKQDIDAEILGKNESADGVITDIVLPQKDNTGNLTAAWETSMPTVVSTLGKVEAAGIEEPVKVDIKADISDGKHHETYETSITVIKNKNISDSEKAKLEMLEIERDNRSDKELLIPERVGDVEINRVVDSKYKKILELVVFGSVIILLGVYYGFYKLKENGTKRKEELESEYYGFVNRMNIYIGAGLTIQNALRTVIKNRSGGSLNDEIVYTLNRIKSGEPEGKAYIELGKNLGTEEYAKLMSLISQNMEYGNSNLIKLMDSEVKLSFYLKKESIRKKGEKASEKLIFPTLILMFIVMVIVMYPAFVGMN